MNPNRRRMLGVALAASFAAVAPVGWTAQPVVEVWKDPNCGCCGEWVKHLEANGFTVKVNNIGNNAARARLGIPAALGSCHTAEVSGYAIEGHVPAADIKRLLVEQPSAIGIAVPGMPIGSPGMEQGGRRDSYDVLLVAKGGGTRIFQSHR